MAVREPPADAAQPDAAPPDAAPPDAAPPNARGRQALIDAYLACVVEGGIDHATTSVVAESAGFSRGAVHYFFRHKHELLTETFQMVLDDHVRAIRAGSIADGTSAVAGLERLVRAGLPLTEQGRLRAKFLFQVVGRALTDGGFLDRYRAADAEICVAIAQRIERLCATSSLVLTAAPAIAAGAIVSFMDGLTLRLISEDPPAHRDIDAMVGYFVAALAHGEATQ